MQTNQPNEGSQAPKHTHLNPLLRGTLNFTPKNIDWWAKIEIWNWNHRAVLVSGAITILKNMKVNGKDDIPYILWKIIQMFETTRDYEPSLTMINHH